MSENKAKAEQIREQQKHFISLRGEMLKTYDTLMNTTTTVPGNQQRQKGNDANTIQLLQSELAAVEQMQVETIFANLNSDYKLTRDVRNNIVKELLVLNHLLNKNVLKLAIENRLPIYISPENDQKIKTIFRTIEGTEPYYTTSDILALYTPLHKRGVVLNCIEQKKEVGLPQEDEVFQSYYLDSLKLFHQVLTEIANFQKEGCDLTRYLKQIDSFSDLKEQLESVKLSETSQEELVEDCKNAQTLISTMQEFIGELTALSSADIDTKVLEAQQLLKRKLDPLMKIYQDNNKKLRKKVKNLKKVDIKIYKSIFNTDLPKLLYYGDRAIPFSADREPLEVLDAKALNVLPEITDNELNALSEKISTILNKHHYADIGAEQPPAQDSTNLPAGNITAVRDDVATDIDDNLAQSVGIPQTETSNQLLSPMITESSPDEQSKAASGASAKERSELSVFQSSNKIAQSTMGSESAASANDSKSGAIAKHDSHNSRPVAASKQATPVLESSRAEPQPAAATGPQPPTTVSHITAVQSDTTAIASQATVSASEDSENAAEANEDRSSTGHGLQPAPQMLSYLDVLRKAIGLNQSVPSSH